MDIKVLESDNILYKPITPDDTANVLKWRNSKAVKANFIYQQDVTEADHIGWLENKVNTGKVIQFIMYEKKSDKPFGSVYLRDVDYEAKKAEFGIFIGEEEFKGKHYGSEATKRMVDFCLEEMNFHKLSLRLLEKNKAALKAYENAGFVVEGTMKDEEYICGKYENVIFMAVINENN